MESIFTLETLEAQGKKVAFINGNRAITTKNLNQKIKSITEYGQLAPLIIVDCSKLDVPVKIVDAQTGTDISTDEYKNYVAIIEGQHRYKAIQQLRITDAKETEKYSKALTKWRKDEKKNEKPAEYIPVAPKAIFCIYPLNANISINKLITEINSTAINWINKDYITGVYMCYPDNEAFQYIYKMANIKPDKKDKSSILPNNGYPLSTLSLMLTGSKKLNRDLLCKYLKDNTTELPSTNTERADMYLKVAKDVGFTEKYLSSRYLIEWAIDDANNSDWETVWQKIRQLESEHVKQIAESDGSISSIRDIIDSVATNQSKKIKK